MSSLALRGLLLAGVLAAAASVAPPEVAAAPYKVNICSTPGNSMRLNYLFGVRQSAPPVSPTTVCNRSRPTIGLWLPKNQSLTDNTFADFGVKTPEGITIADFAINRRIAVVGTAADKTHYPYVIGFFGSVPFEGVGDYADPAWRTQRDWAGYPAGSGEGTVTRASRKALNRYRGNPRDLFYRVGCYKRGSACNTTGGSAITIRGVSLTLEDTAAPELEVAATGLLTGGEQRGSNPVQVTASDGSGIKSVELIDATNPSAPAPVGGKVYDQSLPSASKTATGKICHYNAVLACPNINDELVVPSALQVGARKLVVRVKDTAGNVKDSPPYDVNVVVPSDRGEANGSPETEKASVTARWTKKQKRRGPLRASRGKKPSLYGSLRTPDGKPIANAILDVATRDASAGSKYIERREIATDAEGNYKVRTSAQTSRTVRISWRPRLKDTRPAATASVGLRVPATARIRAPKSVAFGRKFFIRGRLTGEKPRAGVPVILQGFEKGRWYSYSANKDKTSGRGGKFRLPYRFRNLRGRSFRFRVRIKTHPRWPYAEGVTRSVRVRVR